MEKTLYAIDPHYELEPHCRCLSCWEATGKWIVTSDEDVTFEIIFDTEEEAKEWVNQHENNVV